MNIIGVLSVRFCDRAKFVLSRTKPFFQGVGGGKI